MRYHVKSRWYCCAKVSNKIMYFLTIFDIPLPRLDRGIYRRAHLNNTYEHDSDDEGANMSYFILGLSKGFPACSDETAPWMIMDNELLDFSWRALSTEQ